MAKHEFGIMNMPPQQGVRYDEYEPQKYNCISVDDVYIEILDRQSLDIPVFYHTLDYLAQGLNYCGITLIPPQSAAMLAVIIGDNENLHTLKQLLETAGSDNKFVIHYGL